MKKISNFRLWVNNLFYDNKLETDAWKVDNKCNTLFEYFNRYKWWLKREFKRQQENSR